jgi:hypothetical protein
MWRVDFQIDGLAVDALVVSCYPRRLGLDFALYLGEVVDSPAGNVKKLAPLLLSCYARRRMWDVYFVALVLVLALTGQVDELQDEWPPGNDAASSREEVPSDDILEHR